MNHRLQVVFAVRRLAAKKIFRSRLEALPDVSVVSQDIVSVPNIDAVVSPANAFGWMDGGVDQVYVYIFGDQIEKRVQERIQEQFNGRMPVGEAFVLNTNSPQIPWLVVAPTMDVPGPIRGTDNVYLAFKAALTAVEHHNRSDEKAIRLLACPAMGAGTGALSAEESATQLARALSAEEAR